MSNKTVKDIMQRSPVIMDATATAAEAAMRMRDEHIGSVIVKADGGLKGIVTDRDLAVRVLAERATLDTEIGEICTDEKLSTIEPEASVSDAVRLMTGNAVRRIPVVDGGIVGIISIGDLARELDADSALGQIAAAPANN